MVAQRCQHKKTRRTRLKPECNSASKSKIEKKKPNDTFLKGFVRKLYRNPYNPRKKM